MITDGILKVNESTIIKVGQIVLPVDILPGVVHWRDKFEYDFSHVRSFYQLHSILVNENTASCLS